MIWSKSKLKTFRDCPLKFKLAYLDKIKTNVKIESLEKGIKLHEIFDKFYVHYNGDYDEALKATVEKLKIHSDFCKKYKEHLLSFKQFNQDKLAKFAAEDFLPIQAEEWFEAGNWHGFVDRVDKLNNKYLLLDYKTSAGNDISDYYDELIIYAWLYKQKKNIDINYIGILFTKNSNLVIKEITAEEVEENMQIIEKERELYEKLIELGEFKPTRGYWCNWCQYNGTVHCKR